VFGDHGLGGLLKEGGHGKSPKYLGGNLGDFGEFCKGSDRFFDYPISATFQDFSAQKKEYSNCIISVTLGSAM